MHFSTLAAQLTAVLLVPAATAFPSWLTRRDAAADTAAYGQYPIKPKMFIVSLFTSEAEVWYNIPEFNVLARNITVPGLSPKFPQAHCTADNTICQVTLGEGKINAAASALALSLYPGFDLRKTYFMIAGIAGGNPKTTTLNSVVFSRFAVQVDLQYEIDAVELGGLFKTGYIPYGTQAPAPAQYPQALYGTEVFEINAALQKIAISYGSKARLNDSSDSVAYRAKYPYAAAKAKPSVMAGDVLTSDVYYSGETLSEAFSNYSALVTNNTAVYATSAQEDAAALESFMRGAKAGKLDFSRIMVMRTAADFDRPPPGETAYHHLIASAAGAFPPSLMNIYLAGVKVVMGVVQQWDHVFGPGISPPNYLGDVFGTLGGKPDFGPYPYFGEA